MLTFDCLNILEEVSISFLIFSSYFSVHTIILFWNGRGHLIETSLILDMLVTCMQFQSERMLVAELTRISELNCFYFF